MNTKHNEIAYLRSDKKWFKAQGKKKKQLQFNWRKKKAATIFY